MRRGRTLFQVEIDVQGIAAEKYSRPTPQTGFTLLETLITIGVIGIVSAMAFMITVKVMPGIRADTAMQQATAQFRLARETAIDQRRSLLVTFQGTGEIQTVRQNLDITTTPPTVISTTTLADYTLPNGIVFAVVAGVPDTPDGFGNTKPDSFNCGPTLPAACTIVFQSDGSVVDSGGALVNGTLFIGVPLQKQTARAITIVGATGRIRSYRYTGAVWH